VNAGPSQSTRQRSTRAILVLGRGLKPDGTPKPELVKRLETALDEAKRQPDAKVVVTGGAVHNAFSEAEAMRTWLLSHGLEDSRIVTEDRSRITLENVENTVPWFRSRGVTDITLVTERFHMARSRDLLVHALKHGQVRAQVKTAPADDGLQGQERFHRAMLELRAWQKDRVNQVLLHSGRDLFFVGPQVLHAGNSDAHRGGALNWDGLRRRKP